MTEVPAQEWQAQLHELSKKVYVDGEFIVINIAVRYEIHLSRCNTPEKLLGWILHLCEKTWMSPAVLERFIEVAEEANHITIERSL